MPKRRKKFLQEQKPALLFTESPVHIENNIPSPVLCARHPPTAKSIQVDDLQSLTWVSPQFKYTVDDGCGRAQRRTRLHRRHSVAAHRCLSNTESTGHNHTVVNKLRKYTSLKFVGEKKTVQSLIEDVDISFDTASDNDDRDSKQHRIDENVSPNKHDVQKSPSLKRDGESSRNKILHVLERNRSYSDNAVGVHEAQKGSETFDPKPPIKRLFIEQLQNTSSPLQVHSQSPVRFQKHRLAELDQVVSETSEEDSPRLRRSRRLQLLESQNSHQQFTGILAPDTPEAEYDWSIRKRQLKKHLRLKAVDIYHD
ncbi:hypothetical protein MAR_008985 [Mya arenaria]|uniref:Uncharacterized protein n=1 Tax=Mya arenaria TaxID=6604 RepID=A0ABY7E0S1_MYAAR|nr:uncharacterized protein LOC128232313 [Mya arenaria]WAR02427.1 hypothetical protein MAR_008985 [Mya arenaria]